MSRVIVYGAAYSVYVRIARLVLEEIGVPYELVEIDIFARESVPPGYAARHPFGKIPAFEHDGFRLFETDAIARYAIEALGQGDLMPATPRERARTIQTMRIMDNYAYPSLVWGVFVEEIERGRARRLSVEEVARARRVLDVLHTLMDGPFLVGNSLTLADLWAAPMFAYLRLAPTGQELIAQFPRMLTWSKTMAERASLKATQFPREQEAGGETAGGA